MANVASVQSGTLRLVLVLRMHHAGKVQVCSRLFLPARTITRLMQAICTISLPLPFAPLVASGPTVSNRQVLIRYSACASQHIIVYAPADAVRSAFSTFDVLAMSKIGQSSVPSPSNPHYRELTIHALVLSVWMLSAHLSTQTAVTDMRCGYLKT